MLLRRDWRKPFSRDEIACTGVLSRADYRTLHTVDASGSGHSANASHVEAARAVAPSSALRAPSPTRGEGNCALLHRVIRTAPSASCKRARAVASSNGDVAGGS